MQLLSISGSTQKGVALEETVRRKEETETRIILAHCLRAQYIMLESQDRSPGRWLATSLPVRKQQGVNAGAQLTFSFLLSVHTSPWDGAVHSEDGFSVPLSTLQRNSLTGTPMSMCL